MLKFWAFFALMTFAVNTASCVERWTYYKAEYGNKKRCPLRACDLGPHAFRGMQFEGPAWSVKFFFDDPQIITESPWYARIRREAPPTDEPVQLVDLLHEYDETERQIRSSYKEWSDANVEYSNFKDHDSYIDHEYTYERGDYYDHKDPSPSSRFEGRQRYREPSRFQQPPRYRPPSSSFEERQRYRPPSPFFEGRQRYRHPSSFHEGRAKSVIISRIDR